MYGILFSISFIVSIILLVFLYKVKNAAIAKLLIISTLLISFWLLMEILSYYIKASEITILFRKAEFISIIFISPLYLLIINEYATKKIIDINPAGIKLIMSFKNKKFNIKRGMNFIGIKISDLLEFVPDIKHVATIKELGIGISIDDFGTGLSSLSYLTRLPVDYLKIDKSFIDDIVSTNHKNLTPSIISMAKTLNLKTVAEGVETQEQINRLIDEGCDELQGYYFSKPLIISDFIKYVKQYNKI